MAEEYTAKFKVDISDLKKNISEASKQIKLANATFKAETAGMGMWSQSADGLSKKLEQLKTVLSSQKTILQSYEDQLAKQKEAYAENGSRAEELRKKLTELANNGVGKASAEYIKYEDALKDCLYEQQANEKAVEQLEMSILQQKAAVGQTESQIKHYTEAQQNMETRSKSLTAKIEDQEKELSDLKREYVDVITQEDKNSDSAKELARKIESLSSELKENKDRMDEAEKEADQLDNSMKDVARSEDSAKAATERLNGGFTVLKGVVVNLVTDGLRRLGDALKSVVTEGAKYADDMITLSQQTSISTDTLQKFDYMAGLVDVDLNTVAGSMKKLTKNMSSARKGTGNAYDAFQQLGVSITDVNGNLRDNEDVFYDAIDALGKIENETERDAVAMNIFGKSATDLNPLIEAGSDALRGWSEEAEEMGYVMDEDALKGLQHLQDSFDRFNNKITVIKNSVASGLAPALDVGVQKLTELADSVDWDKVGETAGNFLNKLIDGFTWIIEHGALVKGVLAGILAAFAASKIAQVVQGIAEMTQGLLAMNAAASANPYVLLMEVLAALVVGVSVWGKSLSDAYWAETQLGQYTSELTDELEENKLATDELVSSYESMDKARESVISAAEAEADHLESLVDELGNLVDANGEVKDSDKARADFILTQLNEALGTEYTLNDIINGQIDNMTESVYKLIEAKRIEAIMSAQEEGYAQAITQRSDAEALLADTVTKRMELEKRQSQINAEIADLEAQKWSNATLLASKDLAAKIEKLEKEKEINAQALEDYEKTYSEQADIVNKYIYDIEQYESNWEAAHEQNYDNISTISYEVAKQMGQDVKDYATEVTNSTRDANNAWLTTLSEEVSEATKKNVEFRDAGRGMVEAYVDGQKQGEALPANQVQTMAKQMMNYVRLLNQEIQASAMNIPAGIAQGIYDNSGVASNAISWLADSIFSTFNSKMQIKSPSKRMSWSALQMILGIVSGIDENEDKAIDETKSLVDDIISAFNTGMSAIKINTGGLTGVVQSIRQSGFVSGGGGAYGSTTNNSVSNMNYTQNIYAPKQPSRIELYNQTRNLLMLAKMGV